MAIIRINKKYRRWLLGAAGVGTYSVEAKEGSREVCYRMLYKIYNEEICMTYEGREVFNGKEWKHYNLMKNEDKIK